MARVLLVCPWVQMLGGAEVVTLHLLRWFTEQKGAEVTLLSLYPVDQEKLQQMSGIGWDVSKVEVSVAPCPRFLLASDSISILRIAFLHRRAKEIAGEFALCISSYGEIDFGLHGAQIIHHPIFVPRKFLRRYNMTRRSTILDRSDLLAGLYRKLCFVVSGSSVAGFKRNLTLPNTEFLRSVVQEAYGLRGEVLFPAVLPDARPTGLLPWDSRESLVVALGRIAPDKGTLRVMELFAALSQRHPELHYTIVGRVEDQRYLDSVILKGEELHLPVDYAPDASNEQVRSFLSRAKFLLHAKEFEHFGISLVEAADHGCLPLAHDSGGVPEILPSPLLRYRSTTDLLEHFEILSSEPGVRGRVQDELIRGLDRFRLHSFQSTLDRLLSRYIT